MSQFPTKINSSRSIASFLRLPGTVIYSKHLIIVMAGRIPAIRVLFYSERIMDARDKRGHDEG
jgi:hypothetical protein